MAEQHSTHTCEVCGNAFNRRLNNDGSTRKTKYSLCSQPCKSRASLLRRNPNAIKLRDGPKPPCVCIGCGKVYVNKRRSNTEGTKYCSRECALKTQAIYRAERASPKYCRVYVSQCKVCANPILSRLPRLYCGDDCKRVAYSTAPAVKSCKCCGKDYTPMYTGGGLSDYCGDKCREAAAKVSKTKARRSTRAKFGKGDRKRARKYGVEYQPVNRLKVFDRDGWKCQICGKPTPRKQMGLMVSNAPELDHRIPISKGGAHTYSNTQCACRQCNGEKNNLRCTGQLPMFGVMA